VNEISVDGQFVPKFCVIYWQLVPEVLSSIPCDSACYELINHTQYSFQFPFEDPY